MQAAEAPPLNRSLTEALERRADELLRYLHAVAGGAIAADAAAADPLDFKDIAAQDTRAAIDHWKAQGLDLGRARNRHTQAEFPALLAQPGGTRPSKSA